MGTKSNPGDFDCYHNALPDEPMFILLARDKTAATLVDDWAAERRCRIAAGECPQTDMAMVREAMQCAENMRQWRKANDGKWRTETADREDDFRACHGVNVGGPSDVSGAVK